MIQILNPQSTSRVLFDLDQRLLRLESDFVGNSDHQEIIRIVNHSQAKMLNPELFECMNERTNDRTNDVFLYRRIFNNKKSE